MKRKHWLALGAALLLGLASLSSGLAETAGSAVVNWWVMAGGGGRAGAGNVTINDTVGQPIAGASASSDETIRLGAGYWPSLEMIPVEPGENKVYLPLVQQ